MKWCYIDGNIQYTWLGRGIAVTIERWAPIHTAIYVGAEACGSVDRWAHRRCAQHIRYCMQYIQLGDRYCAQYICRPMSIVHSIYRWADSIWCTVYDIGGPIRISCLVYMGKPIGSV